MLTKIGSRKTGDENLNFDRQTSSNSSDNSPGVGGGSASAPFGATYSLDSGSLETFYRGRDSSLRWDLTFRDEALENEYRRRATLRLCTMAAFPYFTVLLYSVYSICLGSIFDEEKTMPLAKWSDGPVIAAYVSCWLSVGSLSLVMLCLSWRTKRFRFWGRAEWTVATTVAIIIMLRVFLGNRWRIARFFGDDPEEIFGAYSQDTELLLNTVMAVAYFGMYTPMRFRPFLLCCCGTSLVSFGMSTAICGSPGNDNWVRDFALCIIVVGLLSVGQRELEKTHRQSWHQQSLDKARIEQLESQTSKHKDRLKKWQEEQEFLRGHLDALSELEPTGGNPSARNSAVRRLSRQRRSRERYSTGLLLGPMPNEQTEESDEADAQFQEQHSMNSTGGTGDQADQAQVLTNQTSEVKTPVPAANILIHAAPEQKSNENSNAGVPSVPQLRGGRRKKTEGTVPNKTLSVLLAKSKGTRWDLVKQCVRMLRNPHYTLANFHEHVTAAFPELEFYKYQPENTGEGMNPQRSTSIHTAEQEYHRTIGALYAIYWLMRIDMKGKLGFCFGHHEDSLELKVKDGADAPAKPGEDLNFFKMTEDQKRANFYHTFPWDRFTEVFQKSGCLTSDGRVCEERCEAMLALTAIHDIFKNEAFLPTVAENHTFEGYSGGCVIQDHDQALNYILVHFPEALPSFAALNSKQRKAVVFTQGKMGFNNGWLVQAEAPPQALFSTFKKLIGSGGATDEDVSFYFVHWLTDLAGAVPKPLSGSEQFVLKFPDYVLAAFLRSFSYVWSLATRTETEVMEDYLVSSWVHGRPDCPVPTSEDAIAIMRLSLQAQRFGRTAVKAFHNLDDRDKLVLTVEMNKTGIVNQAYSTDPCAHLDSGLDDAWLGQQVPAILVYYGPAMLQNNIGLDESVTLRALAEVYRAARSIWPLEEPPVSSNLSPACSQSTSYMDKTDAKRNSVRGQADETPQEPQEVRRTGPNVVTIRIEQLKDFVVKNNEMKICEGWFLVKKNDREGAVERQDLEVINDWNTSEKRVYRWLHI